MYCTFKKGRVMVTQSIKLWVQDSRRRQHHSENITGYRDEECFKGVNLIWRENEARQRSCAMG